MGLFDKFAPKPGQTDEQRVLERLAGRDGEGRISERCLFYDGTDIRVELLDCHVESQDERFAAFLLFRIDRTDLDEPVIEPSTALSTTREEAIDRAADQFAAVMLSFVLSFTCDDMSSIENTFDGKRHIYHYPCTLPATVMGTVEGREKKPFEIVKDDIACYLGARKYNWVKLFAGRTGSEINCEARVNGILIPELCDKLKDHVQQDEDETAILMEKQCVLFVQDDDTYVPLKRSPAEIEKLAEKAIPIIARIHDDDSWDNGFDELFVLTGGDGHLAMSFLNFIPEIVALKQFYFMGQTSDLKLRLGNDGEIFEIKKQQLTAWCAAENAVEKMFYNDRPDIDHIVDIMEFCSSYYSCMCELFGKYSQEQLISGNFSFVSLECPFSKDYKDKIY